MTAIVQSITVCDSQIISNISLQYILYSCNYIHTTIGNTVHYASVIEEGISIKATMKSLMLYAWFDLLEIWSCGKNGHECIFTGFFVTFLPILTTLLQAISMFLLASVLQHIIYALRFL